MNMDTRGPDFFVAGGTLHLDARSYVKRPTDDELFHLAFTGEFCYVLTPRQMGKSSLMIRTAHRLREGGIRTVIIDLTEIGTNVSVDQWYLGLIIRLKVQLRLSVDPDTWWAERASLSAVQRFIAFLHEVVLVQSEDPVVIFVDEIDTTLNLSFSDDFFSAIRFAYNARASDPMYHKLTFILLGVATPADLIKDRRRTPFNIGQRVDLHEFSREDAEVLLQGLNAVYPGQGEAILDRIFYWTSGHPYLAQRLCLMVAEARNGRWTDKQIDRLVEQRFLSKEDRRETNLQSLRDMILAHRSCRQLLGLYRKVLTRKGVSEDKRSPIQDHLKLSGLVKAEGGYLHVRNEIYRRAFDLAWVREHTAINPTHVVMSAAILVTLLTVGFTFRHDIACRFFPRERWCENGLNSTGKTVYTLAGCRDGTLFAGTADGIYRRAPGGTQWQQEEAIDGGALGLASNPDCVDVYAATPNHGILRRHGGLWSEVSDPEMTRARAMIWTENALVAGGDFGIRYLEVSKDPSWKEPETSIGGSVFNLVQSGRRFYAAVWGGGVWYCDEASLEYWVDLNDGLETAYALHAAGSPTEGEPRFVGVDSGFYKWDSTLRRWEKGPQPWGDTRVFYFVIDDFAVYAGQQDNGVIVSTDGGLTWKQMNAEWTTPPFRVHTLMIQGDADDRRWLYAGTSDGVWRYLLPKEPLCNGEFDHNFECWQHDGELDQVVKCDWNQCYAVLGNPDYTCEGGVPVGQAWIRQSFNVPETVSPTLSLKYRVFSYDILTSDLDESDFFQVSIGGKSNGEFGNTDWAKSDCDRDVWDSGWQSAKFDLSPYRGERVELSLRNINSTNEWWNTWTYVDDVIIR